MKQQRPVSRLVSRFDRMPTQGCRYDLPHEFEADGKCWCGPVEVCEGVWIHYNEANN